MKEYDKTCRGVCVDDDHDHDKYDDYVDDVEDHGTDDNDDLS